MKLELYRVLTVVITTVGCGMAIYRTDWFALGGWLALDIAAFVF